MPGGAPQFLGGPVWWYLVIVYVLAFVLGAFVYVDSARPARRAQLAELPEPWWLYAVVEGVFLVLALGVWIPGVPRMAAAIPVLLAPFALAADVAYLLRVVFPKPIPAEKSGFVDSGTEDSSPEA